MTITFHTIGKLSSKKEKGEVDTVPYISAGERGGDQDSRQILGAA